MWIEQSRIMLKTKRKEQEMERQAKREMANLPKLSISPFKEILKDRTWFYNQFIVQIDGQSVSKTLKVRHLLHCVKG